MSQAAAGVRITPSGKVPGKGKLPGLPRGPLSAKQQLEAVQRVQAQAEQRVKLGLQLFKAAEAHTAHQQDVLQQVKAEQARHRSELQEDVTRSLHAYDQWVGQIDESFTRAIEQLNDKVDKLQTQWEQAQKQIESMVRRSEALLDQARYLVKSAGSPEPTPRSKPRPTSASNPNVVNLAIKPKPSSTDDHAEPTSDSHDPPATLSISPTKMTDALYSELLDKLRDVDGEDEAA